MKTIFKKNGGFTLVELIVVIAILAILAAVAIPAYSGYIEKANRAGDEQLLAAVNKAFASACLDNGVDVHEVIGANFDVKTMSVTGIACKDIVLDKNAVNASFQIFFAGNENSRFKVIQNIGYDSLLCMFVDSKNATTISVAYGNAVVNVTAAQLDAIQKSTFGAMGAGALQTQIGKVTDFAASMEIGAMDTVYASEEYTASLMYYLGAKNETEMWEMIAALDAQGANIDQLYANAAVLFAAESTNKLTNDEITAILASGDATNIILNNLNGTNGVAQDESKAMAQAALAYGMYTAYVNQLPDNYVDAGTGRDKEDMLALADNPLEAIARLNDPGFTEYMQKDQAQADLEAYLAALKVIDSAAKENQDAAKDLVENGYANNDKLADLMGGLIG